MTHAVLYQGDARTVLAGLPERSVQCVVTSPPYWGLRDYGTATWEGGDAACDHVQKRQPQSLAALADRHAPRVNPRNPNRQDDEQINTVAYRATCGKCQAVRLDNQLGLERTPEEYVANMVAVFREVKRVLRDDGVCWLNLGDSYAGSYGNQGRKEGRGTQRKINGPMLTPVHDGRYPSNGSGTGKIPEGSGLKPKDLVGIPWRVAFALQADGWWLRSAVTWCKSAPMPESVTDRPTSATEMIFLLTKAERYYYDSAAIAEPTVSNHPSGNGFKRDARLTYLDGDGARGNDQQWQVAPTKNARNWWVLNPDPYPGAHFATFPEELARRCILAGSSNRACEHCGAPWERVTEQERRPTRPGTATKGNGDRNDAGNPFRPEVITATTGWQPTCACANTGTGRCVVLDPFGGSGTVASVATGQGRDAIYIDLNPAYLELARQRIGPMFCGTA